MFYTGMIIDVIRKFEFRVVVMFLIFILRE